MTSIDRMLSAHPTSTSLCLALVSATFTLRWSRSSSHRWNSWTRESVRTCDSTRQQPEKSYPSRRLCPHKRPHYHALVAPLELVDRIHLNRYRTNSKQMSLRGFNTWRCVASLTSFPTVTLKIREESPPHSSHRVHIDYSSYLSDTRFSCCTGVV